MNAEFVVGSLLVIFFLFSLFGMAIAGLIVLIYAGKAENARVLGIRLVRETKGEKG